MDLQDSMYLQPVPLLDQLQRICVEVMLHIIVLLAHHVNVSLQHACRSAASAFPFDLKTPTAHMQPFQRCRYVYK